MSRSSERLRIGTALWDGHHLAVAGAVWADSSICRVRWSRR
ncbi:hypothetical protein ACFVW2_33375 [Streptomyces sp. NPDC058171]